jgi:alkanesulfonate monooxygenase SsuD/methylene tetrahydromethanopterin reductase-like flavin-dependent oxidoreductase (luciferase family)
MRLSYCLDLGRPWAQVLELAQRVEAAGWPAVYVCDHFMVHDPAGLPADGPMLECWTAMTALAARTTTVRIGSLVLGNTYRHPAVLANMAATLDLISGGRLVLGIGAGWQKNEHAAYGIPLPGLRARVAALDEACAVIRGLLDQRRTTIEGSFYQIEDAPCDPKPAGPVPLLVAGAGPGVMRVAARHADMWHCWAEPAEFARKNEILDRFLDEAGRRPGDLTRACGEELHGRSAAEILELLIAYRDAGVDEFQVCDDARVPVDRALDQIDVLTRMELPPMVSAPGG